MVRPKDFNQFQQFLSQTDGYFHVLEQQIPIERQMEYFHYSNQIKQEQIPRADIDFEALEADLYNPEATTEYKRRILVILAISADVTAYRRIERYTHLATPDLQDWAYMAFMEGRIILESELSEEKQIYISTGLGGKGQKLRFYMLFPAAPGMTFDGFRTGIIEREFNFTLQHAGWDIERINIQLDYAELLVLMPLRTDFKHLLDTVIHECNQYGNFMAKTYTITNIKEMSEEEIRSTLRSTHTPNPLEEEQ